MGEAQFPPGEPERTLKLRAATQLASQALAAFPAVLARVQLLPLSEQVGLLPCIKQGVALLPQLTLHRCEGHACSKRVRAEPQIGELARG